MSNSNLLEIEKLEESLVLYSNPVEDEAGPTKSILFEKYCDIFIPQANARTANRD